MQIPEIYGDLFKPSRYKVYYGGRGSGKSESFARALIVQAMERKHLILCTREFQASIQDSVHRLLSQVIYAEQLTDQFEVLQSTIRHRFNGSEFIFKGLRHNITEIKGMQGVTRVWCEEGENISDRSWETLIPTIRAMDSEIWISFNTRNRNDPTYERFVANPPADAIVHKVSFSDNPFFPEVLDKERLDLQRRDPDAYDHIWAGNFDTRRSGAVYAKQLATARNEGRICKVPYDNGSEVFTAWDLGFGDATAIWWLQFVGRELRWLEYYENSGEMIGHYAEVVKAKAYNYARNGHYLPHDAAHGNIRGGSVADQLQSMGVGNVVLDREISIDPGIETVRQTIGYSVFDQQKCKDGIDCLENYGYEWDDDRKVFKSQPRHDYTSHAADAARYACIAAQRMKSMAGVVTLKPMGYYAQRGVF